MGSQGEWEKVPRCMRGLVSGNSVRVWGFTTVAAAVIATLVVAALMWGGAGLPLVLPVAAVGLGIAAWMHYRRRTVPTKKDAYRRERQRQKSSGIEFTEDEKHTLYTGD
jgi:hypothetical protein